MKGKLIVAAFAGLVASACAKSGEKPKADDMQATEAKVKCEGINACKGQGGCKSAANECAGKNGCKGHGWVETSAKDCADKGGKTM